MPICHEWEPSNCSITNYIAQDCGGKKKERRKEEGGTGWKHVPSLLFVCLAAGGRDTDPPGRVGVGTAPGSGAGRYQGGEHCKVLQQGEMQNARKYPGKRKGPRSGGECGMTRERHVKHRAGFWRFPTLGAARGSLPCTCMLGHLGLWGRPHPIPSCLIPSRPVLSHPHRRVAALGSKQPQLTGGSRPPAALFTLGATQGCRAPEVAAGWGPGSRWQPRGAQQWALDTTLFFLPTKNEGFCWHLLSSRAACVNSQLDYVFAALKAK